MLEAFLSLLQVSVDHEALYAGICLPVRMHLVFHMSLEL